MDYTYCEFKNKIQIKNEMIDLSITIERLLVNVNSRSLRKQLDDINKKIKALSF